MASSSKGRAKLLSSPLRFEKYLNGLQKEFELHSNPASLGSNRFNILLGGLKGEFELMALEIESLQKGRDEFKAKVESLTKELQVVRRNLVSERCKEARNAPRFTPSSRFKASATSTLFRPVVQSKSSHKPGPSPRVVNPSQQARLPATHHMTRKPITSAQPLSDPSPDHIDTRLQHGDTPSPVDSDSSDEHHTWSVTFNDEVEKELEVEVAHVLSLGDRIFGVKFSQDGKYLAAGVANGEAYIYSVQTGTPICVLKDLLPDSEGITKVCFSPDGMYLATSAMSGHIYLWEIRKKHVRNVFKGHSGVIHSLNFSPNGRHLVSTSDDNTVRLWNVRDGTAKELRESNPLLLDMPHYRSAIFSPDGRYVASPHRDGMVRIWCVRTGQLMRRVKAYTNWVRDIAFMPDGKGLVNARRDETLELLNISSLTTSSLRAVNDLHEYGSDTEEQTAPVNEGGLERSVVSVAVTPDGRWVISGAKSNIRIWDMCYAATQCILKNTDNVSVETIDISPASGHFAVGDDNGTMTIWSYSNESRA